MQCISIAPLATNEEEIMNNFNDSLTEQELDQLVALDASTQADIAGGATITIHISVEVMDTLEVTVPCTASCPSWVK